MSWLERVFCLLSKSALEKNYVHRNIPTLLEHMFFLTDNGGKGKFGWKQGWFKKLVAPSPSDVSLFDSKVRSLVHLLGIWPIERLGLRVETGPNTQNPTESTREKVVRSTHFTSWGALSSSPHQRPSLCDPKIA